MNVFHIEHWFSTWLKDMRIQDILGYVIEIVKIITEEVYKSVTSKLNH